MCRKIRGLRAKGAPGPGWGASTDRSLPLGPPCVTSKSCRNKNLGETEEPLGDAASCLRLPPSAHPVRPSPQQGPPSDDQTMAVVELPARELQPASTAAAAGAQCHQLVDLLGVTPGTWDLCKGRRQRSPGLRRAARRGLLRCVGEGQGNR